MTLHLFNQIMFVLLIALQLFDFYSTYVILRRGGQELNPVINSLIKLIGLVPALLTMKTIVVVAAY